MAFKLMLAPIERITSPAFRFVCHKYGADVTFTEQLRAECLAKGIADTWSRIEPRDETPVVIQLTGDKAGQFKIFLSKFKPFRGFVGFNLNCGCPSEKVLGSGIGCAMMRKPEAVKSIIKLIKDYGYEASVKIRLGLDAKDKEEKLYLKIIMAVDADYFIVHARHGSQGYKSKADFSVYSECAAAGKEIIANGDIKTREQIGFLQGIGVKGAMIGRAAIFDPGIFNRLKGVPAPEADDILAEFRQLSNAYDEPKRYAANVSNRGLHQRKREAENLSYLQAKKQ